MKKLLFIPLLFICQMSYAEVVITNATGTFSNNQSVQIIGTSFGAGDTTPILYDDFDTGTTGAYLNASPQVGSWTILETTHKSVYSISDYHSGTKSSIASTTDANLSAQFKAPQSGAEMPDTYYYLYYWFKYDNNYTGGIPKLMQLSGTYNIGDFNPGVFTSILNNQIGTYIALENSGATFNIWTTPAPTINAWHCIEYILKQSTVDTADGQVKMIIDGVTIYDKQNVKTRERVGQSWRWVSFFYGYVNSGPNTKSTIVDDAYLNNSWTRVMLCDASTIAASTHRELQLVTGWTDTSINITFKQGSFTNGQTAYLIAVDAAGNESNGVSVLIGGTPPVVQSRSSVGSSGTGNRSTIQSSGGGKTTWSAS